MFDNGKLPNWVKLVEDTDKTYIFANNDDTLSVESDKQAWKLAVQHLGHMIFEKEHPNKFGEIMMLAAKSAALGTKLSEEDQSIFDRFNELHFDTKEVSNNA